MLADVQAPSVLHFENMEMGLFQELKKSKGTGWGVLSEIVHKYPKHQSLQVAISKLKAQKPEEQQPTRQHKRDKKNKAVRLEDLRTSLAAESSLHYKHIETNVKQLARLKEDFSKLKKLNKDQKQWMNRFRVMQQLSGLKLGPGLGTPTG